ncbi:hypothetical protein HMPREF0201_01822 [Cedecea davisae DSM 4568]|uniref:Uncharacterized protein n=1 Tax=Cedecea davisae DSM 4568 TaxID=566551 RepID=S3IVS9_9ENTR|nr:hypothetical protein HMPREF0201_01822 [Cedecea davisae DSM 4568]
MPLKPTDDFILFDALPAHQVNRFFAIRNFYKFVICITLITSG